MAKRAGSIPVNVMIDNPDMGISVEEFSLAGKQIPDEEKESLLEGANQSHRHDSHSFYLLQRGSVTVEIDFEIYTVKPSTIIYIHPDQVHRTTALEEVTVCSLAITNDNLAADYLALLQSITPAVPLVLAQDNFTLLTEAFALCLKLSEQKRDRLYHPLLKDSSNVLVALVLSQYLERIRPATHLSRAETIAKTFRDELEQNYTTLKRPADYARLLHVSVSSLNECVKNATGYSASWHIQQRVVLEAKRLLYHSDRSVKEIASALGYDDYPYFSRLFTKATGMTARAFRNKNRD